MISELKIRNFKSLESVDLKLGHFNLLVGANASGKSNFLDALRFLQGVGRGLSISEILDGKPQLSSTSRWDGIRGGAKYVAFRKRDGRRASRIDFDVSFHDVEILGPSGEPLRYRVCFSADADAPYAFEDSPSLRNPDIAASYQAVFDILVQAYWQSSDIHSKDLIFTTQGAITEIITHLDRQDISQLTAQWVALKPKIDATNKALEKIKEQIADIPKKIIDGPNESFRSAYAVDNLSSMQFLDPLPAALRGYSSKVWRLGEDGEGFAALIHEIETNKSKPALLEWLKELRPDEISDVYAIPGAVNDYMAAIREGDTEFPAPSISEGTLRFIALAAAFFQPSMPKILVIEEIEKGLHPSRLRLLLELMRSQSKRTGTQVFATTHSPTLLAWLTEEDRKTTFVCTRDAESGATKMRSLAEIPRFEQLLEEGSHIDELFAEGWLESAPQ